MKSIKSIKKSFFYIFRISNIKNLGLGHFFRCLKYALYLKKTGRQYYFILDENNQIIERILFENKIKHVFLNRKKNTCLDFINSDIKKTLKIINFLIKEKSNLYFNVVVDHYLINAKWHTEIKKSINDLIVIDDLANKKINCDFLININPIFKKKNYLKNNKNKKCKYFIGTNFFPIFDLKKNKNNFFKNNFNKYIFISFGGACELAFYKNFLILLSYINIKKIYFIMTFIGTNDEAKIIKYYIKKYNLRIKLLINNYNINDFIRKSFFCIGSGGITSWERYYFNKYSLIIKTANNQNKNIQYLKSKRIISYIGNSQEFKKKSFVKRFINNFNEIYFIQSKFLKKPRLKGKLEYLFNKIENK